MNRKPLVERMLEFRPAQYPASRAPPLSLEAHWSSRTGSEEYSYVAQIIEMAFLFFCSSTNYVQYSVCRVAVTMHECIANLRQS